MGGDPLPHFCTNLLVRVKLGYPPNFNFQGKPHLGEKYVHGKKEERRKNNAKFSGHYVRPCTHNMRARARTTFAPIIMPSLVATTSALARTTLAPIISVQL